MSVFMNLEVSLPDQIPGNIFVFIFLGFLYKHVSYVSPFRRHSMKSLYTATDLFSHLHRPYLLSSSHSEHLPDTASRPHLHSNRLTLCTVTHTGTQLQLRNPETLSLTGQPGPASLSEHRVQRPVPHDRPLPYLLCTSFPRCPKCSGSSSHICHNSSWTQTQAVIRHHYSWTGTQGRRSAPTGRWRRLQATVQSTDRAHSSLN